MEPFHTPAEIEARSFAIIDAEVGPCPPFSGEAWSIARRLVHTSGDFSLLSDLHLPDAAIQAGLRALRAGSPIFTDTEMLRAGIPMRRLTRTGNRVECILARPGLAETAERLGITRARAGMLSLEKELAGAVVAIGNAPTALLALLELLQAGCPSPALVIGMPVGFVNAAESKELLLATPGVLSLVLRGRRGGSPLAAATVNALACLLE